MMCVVLGFLLLCALTHAQETCPPITVNSTTSDYDLVSQLTQLCRYDSNVRPSNPLGSALNVSARMFILSLQTSYTNNLQFIVHVLIQLRWQDLRLSFSAFSPRTELVGETEMLSLIWKPHIFLSNERVSQQSDELVSILPKGDVLFTSRIKSTIRCTTEDGNFPFDNQNCKLILDSWRYNSKHLTLQWEPTQPVSISSSAGLTEFLLADLQTTTNENFFTNHIRQAQTEPQCSVYTYDEIDDYNTTTALPTVQKETCEVYSYSSLSLAVILSREYGFYVWDYYFPSVLMVIISWGTFWVEPDIVPARIWIATSTMLGFFALGAMNDAVPTLTQLKTHDIWFVGCTLFILISLIEFAFVNIVHRQELKHHQIKRPTSKYILKSSLKSEKVPWKEMVQKSNSCPSSPEIRNRAKRQSVVGRLQLREEKALSILDLATPITDVKTVRRTQIRISETPIEPVQMTNHEMATWIDRRSRVVFPLAFIAFNVFYWSIMLINFK